MVSLEQIRALEKKVHKTVSLLSSLQDENKFLKGKISQYEKRIEELEYLIEEFKDEQSEIEQGIISALNHLDSLEEAVGGLKQESEGPKPETIPVKPEPAPVQDADPQEAEFAQEAEISLGSVPDEEAFVEIEGEPESEEQEEEGTRKDSPQLDIF